MTGTPIFNRANAPTAMPDTAPFSNALEYLTELIDYFSALTQLRRAHRKAHDLDPSPLAKRYLNASEWSYLVNEEPGDDENPSAAKTRLREVRAECLRRWDRFVRRTALTLEQGVTDLPLERIAREHELCQTEKLILGMAVALSLDPSFQRSADALMHGRASEVRSYMEILGETAEERIRMRRFFISSSRLVASGLISLSHYRGMMSESDFHTMDIDLPRRVSSMLLGEYDVEEQIVGFSSYVDPEVEMDQVVLSEKHKREVLDLVANRQRYLERRRQWGFDRVLSYGRGTVMLFSGPSGTGKTMLAHALARATGHRLLMVDIRKAMHGRTGDFEENLELLFHEARLMRAILFFDEADEMFGDRSFNACMPVLLREFEKLDGVAILATNRKIVLDQALERRILYKLDIEPPTAEQREAIWRAHLPEECPLSDDVDLTALAEEYDIVGGLIKNAVLVALNRALNREGRPRIAQVDLCEGAELQRRNLLERHVDKVTPKVTLEDVALPGAVKAQVRAFVEAARHRRRVFGEWGFGKKLSTGRSLTALFAGAPGVGKTMCAEAVAQALGRNLYPVSLPSLVSKYVGETEKNMRQVFEKARDSGAVLLFDEADALFGSRLEEASSHAAYINGRIDALLQEIERHEGVVILATNRKEAIDAAFERRIGYRVTFPHPDVRAREAIWRGLLPEEAPCDEIDVARLARQFDFTGGTIKNVVLRAAFEAASDGGRITQAILESSARSETPLHERPPIGFGAI